MSTHCQHSPACPSCDASDASAARIISEHLQDCGYALLCNGLIILEGDGTLTGNPPRRSKHARAGAPAWTPPGRTPSPARSRRAGAHPPAPGRRQLLELTVVGRSASSVRCSPTAGVG